MITKLSLAALVSLTMFAGSAIAEEKPAPIDTPRFIRELPPQPGFERPRAARHHGIMKNKTVLNAMIKGESVNIVCAEDRSIEDCIAIFTDALGKISKK